MAVFTAIGAALFPASAFFATLTAGALQVAAGIGLSLISKAIAGEPEPPKFGVQARLQGGDDVPRSIIFGRTVTAGSLAYHNTWGTANGVPNAFHTRVLALADYPIQSITRVWVNELESTLLTGEAHPQYGWPISQYRKGGVDHMWVKFYDGTQTAADSFLVGSVSRAPRTYSANRVGRGIPYAIVTCLAPERIDGEERPLFSGGPPPIKFEVVGARLYDPSKDSTVGGDGPQRWADRATWGGDGDHLPIVQAYNILRGITYNGQWLYGLQSVNANRIPPADVIAQINKCRALFEGPSGMEPQYRSGGEVQVAAPLKTALEAMLTSCQGRMLETGGAYKFRVGAPDTPVFEFTDADIISTAEQSFTPFYGLEDTVNGIQATYPNPNEGWKNKTAPPLLRSDLEALDGGRRLLASVSLDMVYSIGQVERLQKSALEEAQRARRHTFQLGPEAWVLEPGDVVVWTSERNGYVDKLFRVDGVADRSDLDVLLDLTEVDPADYDWDFDADFTPVTDGPLVLVDTPPLPAYGWQVYGVEVLDNEGRSRRPGIEVSYDSGLSNIEFVRIQVRMPGATNPFIDVSVPYGSPWRTQIGGNFINATEYEARGIFVTYDRAPAEWSAWLSVTTPDVKLTPGLDFDPFEGVVGFDQLGDDLAGYLEWIGQSPRELIEAIQNVDTHVADQEASNALTFKEVRTELAVSVGTVQASFEQTITVAIVPLQNSVAALADYLTELSAGDGADVSTARFRMTTLSGPTGYSRIGAETRVDTADPLAWRGAAWYLDTPTNPALPTRFVVQAEQFIVTDGVDFGNPFIFDSGGLRVNNAYITNLSSANIEAEGITADSLAAGSITSDKINVAQLVASDAFLENLEVGSANIQNAAIGTLQLATQSVTKVRQNLFTSGVSVPSNNLSTLEVPATDYPPTVVFSAVFPNVGEYDFVLVEITTGQELARARPRTIPGGVVALRLVFTGYGVLPPTTTTYRVRIEDSAPASTINTSYLNFIITYPER